MKPWRTGDAPVRSAKDSLLKRGQDMNRLQERHRVAKAELQLLHATLATVRTRAESLRESVEFREATEPLYPELTELLDALLA
jgi:prefoldin subunit 5